MMKIWALNLKILLTLQQIKKIFLIKLKMKFHTNIMYPFKISIVTINLKNHKRINLNLINLTMKTNHHLINRMKIK
jgi:hypothetical protein